MHACLISKALPRQCHSNPVTPTNHLLQPSLRPSGLSFPKQKAKGSKEPLIRSCQSRFPLQLVRRKAWPNDRHLLRITQMVRQIPALNLADRFQPTGMRNARPRGGKSFRSPHYPLHPHKEYLSLSGLEAANDKKRSLNHLN